MGPEMDDNADLQLDTGSVRDRVGVRSSLTDINRISVFTDAFIEEKEAVEQEKQAAKEKLQGTVFVELFADEAETGITDLIFLDHTEELLIRNEQEAVERKPQPLMWTLPAAVMLFAATIFYIIRKGKAKEDADDQSETVV
ncbi:MAG: hypothetical protein NC302_04920 [Bacteroidales bacterium]|nr:hypothetical protein [Bacteroidales bacterium]MCM1416364.1 hypothetical protein [bacterium]MCM1422639.1 hypothetical protein [bacterium]